MLSNFSAPLTLKGFGFENSRKEKVYLSLYVME